MWLSIDQMAELFQRDKSTISRHIKNIYSEEELVQEATVAYFATVQNEGNRQVERSICYYNLDVIISVGYRVKSKRGTQFRIWATGILKEYMRKGFALDDDEGALTLNLNGEFAAMVDETGAMNYHPYKEVFDMMDEVLKIWAEIPYDNPEEGMQLNM